jgi:DNA repair protein RadB
METKIPSGTVPMDWLLDGGYEKDIVTCIYGPPGCGKTNLALLCIVNSVLATKKKVIFIDTEGNFSVARFRQVCDTADEALQQIIFLRPTNFEEQAKAVEKLRSIADEKKIGLIVLDSAAMLYRLELGRNRDVYAVNREFGVQLSCLTEVARKKNIPVIITNQIYADFDDDKNQVKIVGGDILRYASKALIELQKLAGGNRLAILRKHRSLPERQVAFKIVERGIEEVTLQEGPADKQEGEELFAPASAQKR